MQWNPDTTGGSPHDPQPHAAPDLAPNAPAQPGPHPQPGPYPQGEWQSPPVFYPPPAPQFYPQPGQPPQTPAAAPRKAPLALMLGGMLALGLAAGAAGVSLFNRPAPAPAVVAPSQREQADEGKGEPQAAPPHEGEERLDEVGAEGAAGEEWASGPARLLVPAKYAKDDLPPGSVRDGQQWLALEQSGDDFALEPARLRTEEIADPTADLSPEQEATDTGGLRISVGEGTSTVPFLLGGVRGLKPGPVECVWARKNLDGQSPIPDEERTREPLGLNTTLKWKLGESGYSIGWKNTAGEGSEEVADTLRAGSRLTLTRDDGTSQNLLLSGRNIRIMSGEPLWAGDLDGDGRLDLYLRTAQYRAGDPTEFHALWISSRAEPGDLVGKVAEFGEAMCCL